MFVAVVAVVVELKTVACFDQLNRKDLGQLENNRERRENSPAPPPPALTPHTPAHHTHLVVTITLTLLAIVIVGDVRLFKLCQVALVHLLLLL